ncbi:MAG TPA: integrase [Candidatus Hydrogenedentes bacterium]|nr:integrase [Candidatus Hydrogenedentota bacterium]
MPKFIGKCCSWVFLQLNIVGNLTAENLALRHQLNVLKRNQKRPKLKERDRLFWVFLSRFWSGWRSTVMIVQPDTVVRWHKRAFKLYWRRKSRSDKRGRPAVNPDVRALIYQMADVNTSWGAPKIHGELLMLGLEISERTVSGLLRRYRRKPPSQTWKTFIKNHMDVMVAVDFLVVPTIRFRMLYVFVILSHSPREVIHFNVTEHPTAEWTAQQVIEAFPWDTAPRYLLRDRDSIYGGYFRRRVDEMGIEEVVTAYHSPWQNAYVERLNGSIRRECTDHVIVFSENHLRRILRSYFEYYNNDRTHLGLEKETPKERAISNQASPNSRLVELPRVGGFHHRYEWSEAA